MWAFERQPLFRDRREAGEELVEGLALYRGKDALVLGIPRGGVPVAAEIARRLGAELDVVVARKLGAPGAQELAIGAVTANGGRFLNDDVIEELFRGGRALGRIEGRTVIVVDDGLATGATMRAAVRSVRAQEPWWLVVAVPVGSTQACTSLRQEADEVVCLHELDDFFAVGLYYRHFEPVEDEEVQRLLAATTEARQAAPALSS